MKDKVSTGQRITWRSLTFQLLVIVVFPLIALLLVITFGSSTLHENAMRDLVGDRDGRAARMAAAAIEDQVQRRANEIRALAGQVSEGSASSTDGTATGAEAAALAVLENAAYLQADFDGGLAILGKEGQVIAFQGDPIIWREQTNQAAAGLESLKNDPQSRLFVSNVGVSSGQQNPFMIVMAPAEDGLSVVAGAFYTGPLAKHVFTNVFTSNQEFSLALVGPDGSILYRQGFNSPVENVSQHKGVADALSGKNGTTSIDIRGSEHVVSYSPVTSLGWALLIEEPWEQVASPVLQTTHMAPLVMVPVLLLALLAIFFGIRQIVQPLQALAIQSDLLGWGGL